MEPRKSTAARLPTDWIPQELHSVIVKKINDDPRLQKEIAGHLDTLARRRGYPPGAINEHKLSRFVRAPAVDGRVKVSVPIVQCAAELYGFDEPVPAGFNLTKQERHLIEMLRVLRERLPGAQNHVYEVAADAARAALREAEKHLVPVIDRVAKPDED